MKIITAEAFSMCFDVRDALARIRVIGRIGPFLPVDLKRFLTEAQVPSRMPGSHL